MTENKNNQFNNRLERERFSNFVVDLRALKRPLAREADKKEKRVGSSLKKQWQKVADAVKNIRPNLIAREKKANLWSWRIIAGKIIWSKLKFRRQLALPFSPRTRLWRKFVKERERIFSAHPVLARFKRPESRAAALFSRYRQFFYFAFVLFFIILFLQLLSYQQLFDWRSWQRKIMSQSTSAVDNLLSAGDAASRMDFRKADLEFQAASANFLAAQEDLGKINDSILSLASFSSDPKIKLAAESKKFLAAGAEASSLGRNLILATDSLFQGNQENFAAALDNFLNYGHQAVSDAQALRREVTAINIANLPAEYQAKFQSLSQQAALLADNLANFVSTGDKLKEFFGLTRDKRYLLVFQNNAELRASGGFLGSYALVDFRDGKIRNLEVPGGGSYDTEAGLKERIAAPQPLWLVNPLWHFWDANWWPDWPTTAQNLMWFYEHSDGPSVDGVISVTPTVMERLLEITGPIDLQQEYGLTIDSDNFWETVQSITERKNLEKTGVIVHLPTAAALPLQTDIPLEQGLAANAANKPKKIIGDLLAKILEILPAKLNKENLLKIIVLFEENMSEKQILFYFKDPVLQAGVASHNWAGEIRETNKDYLLVINTNIAGQKSDRLMSEKIEQLSEVASDGSIINTLRITRTHQGRKNEPLTGVRNVDWLRVYVPSGSELLSAEGFRAPDPEYLQDQPDPSWQISPLLANERLAATDATSGTKIYSEKNKTVFANWVMVDPGETAIITLRYRLPFSFFSVSQDTSWLRRLNDWLNPQANRLWPYSLLIQKQPGAKASEFSGRLILPAGNEVIWRYPDDLAGMAGWNISARLDSDKYWSVLVKQNK